MGKRLSVVLIAGALLLAFLGVWFQSRATPSEPGLAAVGGPQDVESSVNPRQPPISAPGLKGEARPARESAVQEQGAKQVSAADDSLPFRLVNDLGDVLADIPIVIWDPKSRKAPGRNGKEAPREVLELRTDAQGRFRVNPPDVPGAGVVPKGGYRVGGPKEIFGRDHWGYLHTWRKPGAQWKEHDVCIDRPGTIRGAVRSPAPIRGVKVSGIAEVEGARLLVGLDGNFEFEWVPAGLVILSFTRQHERAEVELDLPAGGQISDLEVRLDQTAWVSGVVLGSGGEPVKGCRVKRFFGSSGIEAKPARYGWSNAGTGTDDQGRFVLRVNEIGESVQLGAYDGFDTGHPIATVEVALNAGHLADVVLQVRPQPITVQGVVRFRGEPVPDVSVELIGADGRKLRKTRADASGRYSIELGAPTRARLRAMGHPRPALPKYSVKGRPAYGPHSTELQGFEFGRHSFDVHLPPGQLRIEMPARVDREGVDPGFSLIGGWRWHLDSAAKGGLSTLGFAGDEVTICGLRPGEYRMKASRKGELDAYLDLEFPVAGDKVIAFDSVRPGLLALTILDPNGVPLEQGLLEARFCREGLRSIDLPAGEDGLLRALPGAGHLVVSTEEFIGVHPIQVSSGSRQTVHMQLEAKASFALTVTRGGEPIASTLEAVHDSGLQAHAFGFTGVAKGLGLGLWLPPGSYSIQVTGEDGASASGNFPLAPGEKGEWALELEP